MRSPGSKSTNAFSLVEVSLALAIVGIAFTVIIGMLPVGLRQSRAATDTTNDARILSAMTAIIQSTEYMNLPDLEKKIYYFDADGGFLEIKGDSNKYEKSHVYQASFLLSKQPAPGSGGDFDEKNEGLRVLIVQGRMSGVVTTLFGKIADGEFTTNDISKNSPVKVTPVVVAKMDNNIQQAQQ
jgi:uncharacterized protein (TIGR02598 family)